MYNFLPFQNQKQKKKKNEKTSFYSISHREKETKRKSAVSSDFFLVFFCLSIFLADNYSKRFGDVNIGTSWFFLKS